MTVISPVAPSPILRGRTLNAPPSRIATIRTMLEQHHWLTDPQRPGAGGATGTGLILTPHEPRCNMLAKDAKPPLKSVWRPPICTCRYQHFAELGKLLEDMRIDRSTPLVDGHSVRSLRWHLVERYLRCTHTPKTVQMVTGKVIGIVSKQLRDGSYRPTITPLNGHQALVHPDAATWDTVLAEQRRKRSITPTEMRVTVATWNHQVQPAKVTLGITWLANNWTLKIEPELPAENLAA